MHISTCRLRKDQFAVRAVSFTLLIAAVLVLSSRAGGGPENVFLLVNSASQDSMTVANHYINIRKIPSSNIYYLKWDKEKWLINGKSFRESILLPVFKEIEQRGLAGQIDYLVYSCDLPGKVDFFSEFSDEKFNIGYQPRGSITGSTYLWAFVKENRKEMFGLNTNYYFSLPKSDVTISRGFRSQYRWLPGGQRANGQGLPYMLSMMLGVTYGKGNSVEEIIKYLKVAREADATHPRGTVYFLQHEGPRSKPRNQLFPGAARELGVLGVKAEIIKGKFPERKRDIIGLSTGVPVFDFPASGCRMLPGSIGDNLTSTGGVFEIDAIQTPLTDFLRYGASGACGTVHEPMSFPQKFPTPYLHVHYANGCSMAEAFYQSIHGPFQQLLVGDPLCQPWANIPEVKVVGPTDKRFVSGTITLAPTGALNGSQSVRYYELFIDGKRRKRCRPRGSFSLDTKKLADGTHELRVVAIDDTPIETQGRWIGNLTVKNGPDAVQLSIGNQEKLSRADYVVIKVSSTRNNKALIMHNHRVLAEVPTGNGSTRIALDLLGSGPITLQAKVEGDSSLKKGALFSKPVSFVIP